MSSGLARLEKLRSELTNLLGQPGRKIRKQDILIQVLEMYELVEYLMVAMKEHDEFASSLMSRPMVKVDPKSFEKLFVGRNNDEKAEADDTTAIGHYL